MLATDCFHLSFLSQEQLMSYFQTQKCTGPNQGLNQDQSFREVHIVEMSHS